MKKISILIAITCALIMTGCAGHRAGKRDNIADRSAKTKAAMSSYTAKTAPIANDTALISDSESSNATKKVTLGAMPISTATQTALNGKANSSAFASQSAFTAAWGWTPGGISAWSDVQALISGTGDYIKYDGTRGTPSGSLPTGTEGQTIQYGSGGTPAAVNMAPLTFVGSNISYNEETGLATVPVTNTATSGSSVPFTSGGAYTALGGKENADSTIIKVAEIDTQAEFEALVGWTIPSGGTGGYVSLSAVPYSDVACTTGQYGYYGTTAYLCTGGFWASKWTLTTHSNPTTVTYSLTITPSGFTGADKFTYLSTDYTTEQVISGLIADESFTVTPDTGRAITCAGTGLTDNTGGSYTANTDTANVVATCTSAASTGGVPDFAWNGDNVGGDLIAAKKSGTVTGTLTGASVVAGGTDPGTASSDGGDVLRVPQNGNLRFIDDAIANMQTGYLSMYLYVPASTTGYNEFFNIYDATSGKLLYFSLSGSKTVRFTTTNSGTVQNDSTTTLPSGWHLFEARWSTSNTSIRIDGASWENLNAGFTTTGTAQRVYLGYSSQISTNTIYIDGVRLWTTYDQQ